MVATARQCPNRPLRAPVGPFHPGEERTGQAVPPPNTRHIPFPTVQEEDARGQAMRKQRDAYAKGFPRLCFSSPALRKDTAFACWSLHQHPPGTGVPADACAACRGQRTWRPHSSSAHDPAELGRRFCSARVSPDTRSAPKCNPPPGGTQQLWKHCPVTTVRYCGER